MKAKKWNKWIYFFGGFLLSILVSWFILDSLLLSLVFGIIIVLEMLYLQRQMQKRNQLFHHIDASYNFVNLMNIQMLSTSSVYEAYKSIENYIDIDFANMSNEDLQLQLGEIANEYNLNSFKMYINTLLIYMNDGGNYKVMQEIPTSLCQKTKLYYNKLSENKFYKLIEITSLFILWLLVFMFLKISIPEYYGKMMENTTYQFIMLAILIAGSFFYYLSFSEYLKNKIRGL